jgi:tyrosinase
MARTRRNVMKLDPNDDTVLWYARAVKAMWNRPITDHTSWRFQAAIHRFNSLTPLQVPGETLPSNLIRAKYWSKCEHGTWFFLPWHRMYLYYFEQIVAAEVVKLGGPSGWTLPYWNYSENIDSRLLPAPFREPTLSDGTVREPTLSDGTDNALCIDERTPDANSGLQFLQEIHIDLSALDQLFFGDEFAVSGFGPDLENTPHGDIHVALGGNSGWMAAVRSAALDPIFWLHHCNLDRLWEVWLKRNPNHKNPTESAWLTQQQFDFLDAVGTSVSKDCSEVLDTTSLDYIYDDVNDPLPVVLDAIAESEVFMPSQTPPEVAGATDRAHQVQDEPVEINIPTPFFAQAQARSAAAAAASSDAAPAKRHYLLRLENITAPDIANSYAVYVNVPAGERATDHPELLAGSLSMFGVAESSQADDRHPGSGLTYMLDITRIYDQLALQEGWDPQNVRVTLVRLNDWTGAPANIGRVSVLVG